MWKDSQSYGLNYLCTLVGNIQGALIGNNWVETSSFPWELISFRDLIVFMISVVETGLSATAGNDFLEICDKK
jgi:hypothetical protein